MNAARSQTWKRLVISVSAVVVFTATASTAWAQTTPDLFTRVERLTLSDGTPAVGSVTIGGDTAIVNGTGGLYVFEREPDGDYWAHTATLDSGGGPVAIDGRTIVVGAAGAASVFRRGRGTRVWQEAARLTGDENPGNFGASVAVSGTTVVVGAPGIHTPDPGASPGVVYVFERDEGGPDKWGEVARLVGPPLLPGPRSYDNVGLSAALDGDTLVIGYQKYVAGIYGDPRVLVFSRSHRDSNVWTQVAMLQLYPDPAEVGGGPVDISGNRILASFSSGSSYPILFEQRRSSDEWNRVAGFGATSGGAQISGDSVVTTTSVQQAEVHVYARNQDGADQWGEVARGFNPLPRSSRAFKIAAISGDTILAGGFLSETGGPPRTYTEVEVYVADADRDGLRDGRDPCLRDPLNNVAGHCLRASAVHPVLDEVIAQGDVTSETRGRRQIITATFTNTSDTAVHNPFFEVTELTGRNVLLNGDAGPGGIGATLSPDVGDGILSPGESTTVTFVIGLATREAFSFYVSVRGDAGP